MQATTPESARTAYAILTDVLPEGESQAIQMLYEAPTQLKAKGTQLLQWLAYIPTQSDATTANELYQPDNFNIETWHPNEELQQHEIEFLKTVLDPNRETLELAVGAGRLILPLLEAGYSVQGIDIIESYISNIKQKNPKAAVFVESWYHTHFLEKQFQAVYCFGRSLPHIFSITQWGIFLHEMERITDVLYGDFAKPDQGFLKEQIEKFEETSESLSINKTTPGIHIGTPDRQHYTPRFSPNDEQLIAIAKLSGWNAQIVEEKEYTDQAGKKNLNVYWKFSKSAPPQTYEEFLDVYSQAKIPHRPIQATSITA